MQSKMEKTKPKQITEINGQMLRLDELIFSSMDITEDASKYMAEKMKRAGMDDVVNGSFIEASVNKDHQKYVQILRARLIAEYSAQSASEYMLVDISINAYFRYMRMSKTYDSIFAVDEEGSISYNQLKLNLAKELGKHVELAHRQFVASLAMLKEMKRPTLNVRVHSKQAFIAQNQQFNKHA